MRPHPQQGRVDTEPRFESQLSHPAIGRLHRFLVSSPTRPYRHHGVGRTVDAAEAHPSEVRARWR